LSLAYDEAFEKDDGDEDPEALDDPLNKIDLLVRVLRK
jgi:hypothetical protein